MLLASRGLISQSNFRGPVQAVGVYGRKMAENWPYTPALLFLGAYPPHFSGSTRAPGIACPQFSAYRLLVPCVGASRPRNWVLPGVIRQKAVRHITTRHCFPRASLSVHVYVSGTLKKLDTPYVWHKHLVSPLTRPMTARPGHQHRSRMRLALLPRRATTRTRPYVVNTTEAASIPRRSPRY